MRGENTEGGNTTPLSLKYTLHTRHTHAFVRRREAEEKHYIHARCSAGFVALWRAVS